MDALELSHFSENVGDEFKLTLPDGERTLKLTEATALSNSAQTNDDRKGRIGKSFSLIFEGCEDEAFDQGTFQIEHPKLGAVDIFLVPIGPDRYESIFN